jgi:hypothetical protein
MKRAFLSAVIIGATIAPALAGGGGGADTSAGHMLIQVAGHLIGKIASWF